MVASNAKAKAAPNATEREFVITRVLDAPRDLVWQAWTDAERLAQWWGPKGCTIRVGKLDVRPGGVFHYAMQWHAGHDMWGRFVYREIKAPERLVFVNSFSDEVGNITRAPFSQTWPLEVLNHLTLSERDGKTTLTLRGGPINATDEERKTFESMFESLQHGFGGTFDQLDAYLAKTQDAPAAGEPTAMKAEPQAGHHWLHKLVGEWTYEADCAMGPGQPRQRSTGSESVRSLGGLWTVGEGQGEMPGGGGATTIMTLGYNPQTKRFVGAFIASMMTHLWIYDGALDAAGHVLTLAAEGPSFAGDGTMAKYRDAIEFKSDDHRVLTSRVLGEDGTWSEFMTAHYRRTT